MFSSRRVASALVVVLSVGAAGAAAQRFGAPPVVGRPAFACPIGAPVPGTPSGETPSRTAVVEAMNVITPAIYACTPSAHGEVSWGFSFRGVDGAVTEVRLREAPAPTPSDAELRCMELAACAARLTPFARDTFTVNYPFRY